MGSTELSSRPRRTPNPCGSRRASREPRIDETADLLQRERALHIDPVFALSPVLGAADADVIADGLLIGLKASRDRSVIGSTDIYQRIGYALADLYDWYGIQSVGEF